MRETGYLNGLRALAAYWVLVAHCFIWSGHPAWFPTPKLAVCIFMILSGYVMAYTADGDWRAFYLRRIFRIAPLYYGVLAMALATQLLANGYRAWGVMPAASTYLVSDASLANVLSHLTFAFGLSPHTAATTGLPDWSLSLEMQFYIVFPLISMAMLRWSPERVAIALAIICLPIWAGLRSAYPDPSLLPLQLIYFLAGILLCQARGRPALAALAIMLSAFEVGIYGPTGLIVPAIAALIASLDRLPLNRVRRLLDNAVTKEAADLSYGVYLTHGFFIAAGGLVHASVWLLIPVTLVGATSVSYLLHRLIERPGIALGRRLSALQKRADRGAVAVA